MAEVVVVYWRGIPAQVIVRAGRRSAKRQLDERFQRAIDRAAMRAGLRDSDAYLGQWRRERVGACDDDLDAAAQEHAARLEADYPDQRLRELIAAGGQDTMTSGSGTA